MFFLLFLKNYVIDFTYRNSIPNIINFIITRKELQMTLYSATTGVGFVENLSFLKVNLVFLTNFTFLKILK